MDTLNILLTMGNFESIFFQLQKLESKCDVIINMLADLSDDPDFLITRLRDVAIKQRNESIAVPELKVVKHDGKA